MSLYSFLYYSINLDTHSSHLILYCASLYFISLYLFLIHSPSSIPLRPFSPYFAYFLCHCTHFLYYLINLDTHTPTSFILTPKTGRQIEVEKLSKCQITPFYFPSHCHLFLYIQLPSSHTCCKVTRKTRLTE